MIADSQWNRSRVSASAPDQIDTESSMMLLAAKPATARARISSDSASSSLSDSTSNKWASKPACLSVSMNGGGAPSDGRAPCRKIDAGAFHAGKPAERLFDRPDACAAMNRGHRQIGLAHTVGYDAAREQHFLAGCARIRREQRQLRSRTATTHRKKLHTPRVKLRAASSDTRASFRVPARGKRRSFPKGRLRCRQKSARA